MTRSLFLLVVSAFVAANTGCQCCNWFRSPTASVMPAAACGVPATTAAMPVVPVAPPPAAAPCAAGYAPPVTPQPMLQAPQGYAPAPGT
jgi:hypothetical protein